MEENNSPKAKHYYYAQLNEEQICSAISDLSGQVIEENMIELATYDVTILGKKYENGEWVEVEQPTPEPETPVTTNEEIKQLLLEVQEQNLILMEAFAESVEAGLTE